LSGIGNPHFLRGRTCPLERAPSPEKLASRGTNALKETPASRRCLSRGTAPRRKCTITSLKQQRVRDFVRFRRFGRPARRVGGAVGSLQSPSSTPPITTLPGGGGSGALQLPPLAMPAVLPSGNPVISRAKINTIKQTVAVIAIYILCSAPFVCVQLWAAWAPETAFVSGKLLFSAPLSSQISF